jgi:molybdopterin converting factor small subunit
MAVTVKIPRPLLGYTGGCKELETKAATIAEIIQLLYMAHPKLRGHLKTCGVLHQVINIRVDGRDIRLLQGLSTPVADDSVVAIIMPLSMYV